MSFFSNIKQIADYLKIQTVPDIHFTPTWHQVAQTFCRWPVVVNENGYKIQLFEWGLIADYMNTPEKIREYRMSMANARSEKIIEDKRSVWHRIRDQRCLVFTTGFFEHHDAGLKKKVPYFIHLKDQPVFCFAGLYNYSPIPDKETGELVGTFSVITRAANPLMAHIHNGGTNSGRMPLVLTPSMAHEWLDHSLSDAALAKILAYECPDTEMEAWPVKTIRTRKEDNADVITQINTD